MARRIGLVVGVADDDSAEVMTDRQSACGGCQDTRGCKSCLSGSNKVVAVVQNDAHARIGDVVEIEHKTQALMGSAGLFYVLPVIGLLAGAFIGGAAAAGWGLDESTAAVLVGAAGLAISLLAIIGFTRTEYARRRLVPHIVRVVESGANGGSRRDRRSPSKAPSRSCCSG